VGPLEGRLELVVGDAALGAHGLLAAGGRLVLGHDRIGEFRGRHFVSEGPERAFGVLHDVALVDQGDARTAMLDGMRNRLAHEPLGPGRGDGLDADTGGVVHLGAQGVPQEGDELFRFRGARGIFDTGVDVLGVLAEDDHVHALGMLDRRLDALEVADGPDAGIEVEDLTHGDVQTAKSTADRGGQRSLEGELGAGEGIQGGLGQILAGFLEGLASGQELFPDELSVIAIGLFHGGIDDGPPGFPYIRTDTVTFDPIHRLFHAPYLLM